MNHTLRIVGLGLLAAVVALPVSEASAQPFPSRPLRLVVPAGPGGPTDAMARLIAERMSAALGQSVVVDNRGGGGGAIGAKLVAGAAPDGYTLLLGNTAVLANIPAVSRSAGYDPVRNLAAVAKVMDTYMMPAVRADAPWRSVGDLLAHMRAHPGRLNQGAAGTGNLTSLAGELLKRKAGVEFVTVQYKSSADFIAALLAGQVDLIFDNVAGLRALIEDGRMRALAVASAARQRDYPDLPTMVEAGVPDYVVTAFFGVVAPAGTPAPVVARLNAVINDALASDAMRQNLERLGARPSIETTERFAAFIASEYARWKEISDASGIKVD